MGQRLVHNKCWIIFAITIILINNSSSQHPYEVGTNIIPILQNLRLVSLDADLYPLNINKSEESGEIDPVCSKTSSPQCDDPLNKNLVLDLVRGQE